jgi:acyl carrier protein
MHQDKINAAFADILEGVANVNQAKVTDNQRLREDLGIDSLLLIDVAVATEDRFGIRIRDDDLERFQTVGDAVGYIRQATEDLEAFLREPIEPITTVLHDASGHSKH